MAAYPCEQLSTFDGSISRAGDSGMNSTMELVSIIIGSAIGWCTLLGFGVRYALLPYLEKKLLIAITTALGEALQTKAEVIAVARMFDGHLIASLREHDHMREQINRLEARL